VQNNPKIKENADLLLLEIAILMTSRIASCSELFPIEFLFLGIAAYLLILMNDGGLKLKPNLPF
jgi:hypothetical protein